MIKNGVSWNLSANRVGTGTDRPEPSLNNPKHYWTVIILKLRIVMKKVITKQGLFLSKFYLFLYISIRDQGFQFNCVTRQFVVFIYGWNVPCCFSILLDQYLMVRPHFFLKIIQYFLFNTHLVLNHFRMVLLTNLMMSNQAAEFSVPKKITLTIGLLGLRWFKRNYGMLVLNVKNCLKHEKRQRNLDVCYFNHIYIN